MEGGWKLKFLFHFTEITHDPLHLWQMFGTVKDNGHTYKFYVNRYFILWNFQNMVMVQNIEVMLEQWNTLYRIL
jgi:hypothetical protein